MVKQICIHPRLPFPIIFCLVEKSEKTQKMDFKCEASMRPGIEKIEEFRGSNSIDVDCIK